MARADGHLRARIHRVVLTVPVAMSRFWLAALASLGHPVDLGARVPDYYEAAAI
jgi:hypothetical protein